MDDIELTRKINSLSWEVDIVAKTCRSSLIHYRIVGKEGCTDLRGEWISPEVPPVMGVINQIQRGAVAAYKKALIEKTAGVPNTGC